MLRQSRILYMLVLLCTIFSQSAFAQESPTTNSMAQSPSKLEIFDDQLDPVYTIASYYNAINLKDHARAYSYWNGNEPNQASLADFTKGFADVQEVQVFVRLPLASDGTAGIIYVPVPVALHVTLNDDSQEIYLGCINTYQLQVPVDNAPEADPNWYLWSASLEPADEVDFDLAAEECARTDVFPMEYGSTGLFSAPSTLMSYYDAIANQDYARAYSYWVGGDGPGGITLAEFSNGFANTSDISVVLDVTTLEIGHATGHAYADMPLILLAENNDVPQFFVGCYIARSTTMVMQNVPADPNWYLYYLDFTAVDSLDVALEQVEEVTCP
jgi:hypothetical protein